jgi:fatty acid desaturase
MPSVAKDRPHGRWRVEVPTVSVATAVYCGFLAITWFFNDLPLAIAAPVAALLLAWQSSLQHETIHGHPTGSRRINTLLGWSPLSLWLPYEVYRETHLRHHRCKGARLTRPGDDPESHYLPAGRLAASGRAKQGIFRFNRTLLGRLTLGPALSIWRLWGAELRRLRAGDAGRIRVWARHAASVAVVLAWVMGICHVSPAVYALAVVYPSISLNHLRSFAEHRSHADLRLRTNVVETGWLFSLLFLNNNLHIAHHAKPSMPWYRLPHAWREMTPEAARTGATVNPGYRHLFRSYWLRPIIAEEYPVADGAPS